MRLVELIFVLIYEWNGELNEHTLQGSASGRVHDCLYLTKDPDKSQADAVVCEKRWEETKSGRYFFSFIELPIGAKQNWLEAHAL